MYKRTWTLKKNTTQVEKLMWTHRKKSIGSFLAFQEYDKWRKNGACLVRRKVLGNFDVGGLHLIIYSLKQTLNLAWKGKKEKKLFFWKILTLFSLRSLFHFLNYYLLSILNPIFWNVENIIKQGLNELLW